MSGLIFAIGSASAFVVRTDVGIRIEQGKPMEAKKHAKMGLTLNFFAQCLLLAVIVGAFEYIPGIFTADQGVYKILKWMVLVLGIQTLANGSVPVYGTILRAIGFGNWLSLVLG